MELRYAEGNQQQTEAETSPTVLATNAKREFADDTLRENKVLSLTGTLSNDFPDDIDDNDLGVDAPREDLD